MSNQPTTTYRPPTCFVRGRDSLVELSTGVAAAMVAGVFLQQLLPGMPRPEREQFISGTHPVCWNTAFGDTGE